MEVAGDEQITVSATVPVELPDDREIHPTSDGWDSEQFSEIANHQLKLLGSLIQTRSLSVEKLTELVDESCQFYPMDDAELVTQLDGSSVSVQRSPAQSASIVSADGVSGFVDALNTMLKRWQGPLARVKFKLVGVTPHGDGWETRQLVTFAGRSPAGLAELHATWIAEWSAEATPGAPPRITKTRVVDAELIESMSEQFWFTDCTLSVFESAAWYYEQIVPGIDYWQEHLESILTGQFGHHGLAIADVNNDGLDDVYLCQPGGLPNMLLVQQPDGTIRNQSAEAGVDFLDLSRSALIIDLDNDGDQDLALATSSRLVFLSNNGFGKFELELQLDTVRDANSLSASDVDLDGDLDLYVCIYSGDAGASRGSPTPIPIHDARNGGANFLFRNDTDGQEWVFEDVTDEVGLDTDNHRWSYAAAWEDIDNDGDSDLYVANDFGLDNLYRNDEGRFVESSAEAGLDQSAFGMSVTWGDYNRDGKSDLYVSNMFSGAGSRITTQSRFQSEASDEIRQRLRYAARGNTLYENQGDGTFRDVSVAANVTMGRWAWGSLFADINNDGWEDLLVGNGFVTRENADDL